MDVELLTVILKYTGLGGLALLVVLLLFRDVLKKLIFSQLHPEQTYKVIKLSLILISCLVGLSILVWFFLENAKLSPSSESSKPTYQGEDSQLVYFEGWKGGGIFSYVGGSCKGCPTLETYTGTGIVNPILIVDEPSFISRIDFLGNNKTVSTLRSHEINSGPNVIDSDLKHSLVKVDGTINKFYGGMTSYCWSGAQQKCTSDAQDFVKMMKLVSYRLNLKKYSVRVVKTNGESFNFTLPKVVIE